MTPLNSLGMGRLSIAVRKRVIILWRSGYSLRDIKRRLEDEEVEVTLRSLQYLVLKFLKFHTLETSLEHGGQGY